MRPLGAGTVAALRSRLALAGLGIGLGYVALDLASGRIERVSQAAAR
jgi:hypothetical protein